MGGGNFTFIINFATIKNFAHEKNNFKCTPVYNRIFEH